MRVTAILNACGLRQWPACVSQADRDFYLNRGTQIHRVTEMYDAGTLDESSVDPRIQGFLDAWKLFRQQVGGKILAQEREVKNLKLGYQGRLDLVLGPCGVCGDITVVDKKTNQADDFTRLQLCGYRACLKYKRMRRMAVSLFETGRYKCEVYDNDEMDVKTWLACCQLATWMERNNIKTKEE